MFSCCLAPRFRSVVVGGDVDLSRLLVTLIQVCCWRRVVVWWKRRRKSKAEVGALGVPFGCADPRCPAPPSASSVSCLGPSWATLTFPGLVLCRWPLVPRPVSLTRQVWVASGWPSLDVCYLLASLLCSTTGARPRPRRRRRSALRPA